MKNRRKAQWVHLFLMNFTGLRSCRLYFSLKPIFYCDQNTWRRGLAFGNTPDTRILRWRYQHVGILQPTRTPKFASPPTQNLKSVLALTQNPNASQWNIGCLRWAPNAKLLSWPCAFHVYCVDFICVWCPTQTQFPVEYGLKMSISNEKITAQWEHHLHAITFDEGSDQD